MTTTAKSQIYVLCKVPQGTCFPLKGLIMEKYIKSLGLNNPTITHSQTSAIDVAIMYVNFVIIYLFFNFVSNN